MLFRSGTIPVGFYDLTTFGPALQNTMNNAIPAPAGLFTVTFSSLTNQFTVTNAGLFFFIPNSSFIQRGKRLTGFSEDIIPQTSKISGFACMAYTRYLVIESPEITSFTKNPYTLSNPLFSNVCGIFPIEKPTSPQFINVNFGRDLTINQFSPTQIAKVSIKVKDEYGEDPSDIAIGDNCEFLMLFATTL